MSVEAVHGGGGPDEEGGERPVVGSHPAGGSLQQGGHHPPDLKQRGHISDAKTKLVFLTVFNINYTYI